MNFQPDDPAPHGHCLRCKSFVIEDEQRSGVCIDCQPIEDGEKPAFPISASEYGGHGSTPGINIRDFFAAKAMSGYLANTWQAQELESLGESSAQQMATVAEISYAMADAMLIARSA